MRIPILSPVIYYGSLFWRYTGYRLIGLTLITFFAGVSESFGIALFLPLLVQTNMTPESANAIERAIYTTLHFFGLSPSVYVLLALILGVFIVKGAVKFAEGSYAALMYSRLARDVRFHMLQICADVNYKYFITRETGYFSNLIIMETYRYVAAFGRFCNIVIILITISVFLLASFCINWKFTVATAVFGTIILYCLRYVSSTTRQYSMLTSREYSRLNSLIVQFLQSFKYLKATSAVAGIQGKLRTIIGSLFTMQHKTQMLTALTAALREPIVIFYLTALMFYQVAVAKGSLAPLLVSIMFFYRIIQHIMGFQREWQAFSSFLGGVEAVSRASREMQAYREHKGSAPPPSFSKAVDFQEVCFAYDEKPVLSSVSLHIPKNKTIALIGESGIGKTTLVDLMTGIITPQRGSITIDGAPLNTIDTADWRSRIGYVTQEPYLFNDTVANNISMWTCSYTDPGCREKIHKAACDAQCRQFIEQLPQRYETVIGERGVTLSGGQRQRVAIARELFRNPELLIMDEATSHLDVESEIAIQQSITALKGNITVVLIAHRISTLRDADYVYILDSGRVAEEGTFDELMAQGNSRLRKLWELQNIVTG